MLNVFCDVFRNRVKGSNIQFVQYKNNASLKFFLSPCVCVCVFMACKKNYQSQLIDTYL